jgi:hypothetical protein
MSFTCTTLICPPRATTSTALSTYHVQRPSVASPDHLTLQSTSCALGMCACVRALSVLGALGVLGMRALMMTQLHVRMRIRSVGSVG